MAQAAITIRDEIRDLFVKAKVTLILSGHRIQGTLSDVNCSVTLPDGTSPKPIAVEAASYSGALYALRVLKYNRWTVTIDDVSGKLKDANLTIVAIAAAQAVFRLAGYHDLADEDFKKAGTENWSISDIQLINAYPPHSPDDEPKSERAQRVPLDVPAFVKLLDTYSGVADVDVLTQYLLLNADPNRKAILMRKVRVADWLDLRDRSDTNWKNSDEEMDSLIQRIEAADNDIALVFMVWFPGHNFISISDPENTVLYGIAYSCYDN